MHKAAVEQLRNYIASLATSAEREVRYIQTSADDIQAAQVRLDAINKLSAEVQQSLSALIRSSS